MDKGAEEMKKVYRYENKNRCENCGKELDWDKNKRMFQTGESKRFYHYGKRGNKLTDIATYCSRKCYKELKKREN